MNAATVHIVGAGMAGLAAAVDLAENGVSCRVHEAAGQAGGRCRSFFDNALGRTIDNGNHLLLSGNGSVMRYLAQIGADDPLTGPDKAAFPFRDLRTGEAWTVRPDKGVVPWSIFCPHRRVPGTRAWDYLKGLRLAWAGADATVARCLGGGPLFDRFWEPLAVGVLNTPAATAAARLLWPVIKETFGRGAAACRPLMARQGLSQSFVDPALVRLAGKGAAVAFNRRLRAIDFADDRVAGLDFTDGRIDLVGDDLLILAVPAWGAPSLVPGLDAPEGAHAIVNAHFRLDAPWTGDPLIGLVGGTAQWVFVRGDVASVTVSAADALAEESADAIADRLWPEVRRALDLPEDATPPAHRVIKEKRATIAQTPAEIARRPAAETRWRNLILAGDWIDTGLPATIEGAVRSGQRAAALARAIVTKP